MTGPGALFLSYASEDAEAARRIAEALRAEGLDAWLDQSELRGGDAWDASIRGKIAQCALFIPIISASTEARGEGYFRLEWRLAVERSRLMADDQAFLVPVVLDKTPEGSARVPDAFRARQWIRMRDGEVPAGFATQLKRLLGTGGANREATRAISPPTARPRSMKTLLAIFAILVALVMLVAVGGYYATKPRPRAAAASSIAILAIQA
jgi:hypothetical protein